LLIYLRDKDPDGLPEKLGEKWKEFQEIKPTIRCLEVFELSGEEFSRSTTLLRSVDDIPLLMVSPDDKFVAFNMEVWARAECQGLFVVPLTGNQPARLVDENVAMNFDWSADGRSLAYVRAAAAHDEPDVLQLGSLCTRAVRDKDGELLPEWEKREDRVGVLFHPYVGIEWLRDGRILFSSVQFTIPATRQDMPKRWSIFSFDPRSPSGVLNVLGANFDAPLDSDVPLFEISPDERRVLLLCKDGQVAVYELGTGETQFVLPDDETESGTMIVPSWRSAQEICFARPAKDESGEKWVISIWRDGKIQPLSEGWTEAMKAGWLVEEKKEE
ncbi:MAG TPA: hypothetical protein VNT79_02905, partial [Phycisphaerae bacterium]|nr:hypothetical protein [Phycisphaerae bacterium]